MKRYHLNNKLRVTQSRFKAQQREQALTESQKACASLIQESEQVIDSTSQQKGNTFLQRSMIPALLPDVERTRRQSCQNSISVSERKQNNRESKLSTNNKSKGFPQNSINIGKVPINLTQYVVLDKKRMKTISVNGCDREQYPKSLYELLKKRVRTNSPSISYRQSQRCTSLPIDKSRIVFV